MKPNAEQIKQQVESLRTIKPNIRKTSMFGDNHHNAIDAQVEVLENLLTDEDIYLKNDSGEWRQNEVDAALEARQWLDGTLTDSEDLVAGWNDLRRDT